jgi:hypothetical protein
MMTNLEEFWKGGVPLCQLDSKGGSKSLCFSMKPPPDSLFLPTDVYPNNWPQILDFLDESDCDSSESLMTLKIDVFSELMVRFLTDDLEDRLGGPSPERRPTINFVNGVSMFSEPKPRLIDSESSEITGFQKIFESFLI